MSGNILDLLQTQSVNQPEAAAILDIDQNAYSYQQLFKTAESTISKLSSMGIGRNDPFAIVLPNGPLMAVAFPSIASCAANPILSIS
jgi:oxalate---CoA ligase